MECGGVPMGLFDKLNKTISSANQISNAANRTIDTTESSKRTVDRVGEKTAQVGKTLAPKCKFCNAELKSDAEKNKGVWSIARCPECDRSRKNRFSRLFFVQGNSRIKKNI